MKTIATVLLLADEPLNAMDIEYALRDDGFDVVVFSTSSKAHAWLTARRPQVAIIDVMLGDGPCHAIAVRLHAAQVPFIVNSGMPKSSYSGSVFAKGVWLAKPSDHPTILHATRQARLLSHFD